MNRSEFMAPAWQRIDRAGDQNPTASGEHPRLAQPQSKRFRTEGINRWRFFRALSWTLALGFALAPQARASFLDGYNLSDFTLINTNADGFVTTPDGGVTAVLTGGNNGSLLPGTTDLVTMATGPGVINFQWSYASLDVPTFDYAGYLLNGNFFPLADTNGESGIGHFPVSLGASFGFRVGTVDNSGEPGILTVSNAPTAVPEPGAAPLLSVLTALTILTRWRRNRADRRKGGEA